MRRMLITAGPTHEPLDRVRYLANRSSGRMGIALAAAAARQGWQVTLLLGPSAVPPPPDVHTARFTTTADLQALLAEHWPGADVLVMAAAVADYRPVAATGEKLPRGSAPLTLTLEPTPDLVAACAADRRPEQRIVAFALEAAAELDSRAAEKLRRKGVDAIVANPLETMDAAEISGRLILADGRTVSPPAPTPLSKADFAAWLVEWISGAWGAAR